MIGIYKIASPSNKVYIGQSWDIQHRWRSMNKKQRYLFASLNKYGKHTHKYEVIHELPNDVEQFILNSYEQLYIDLYRDAKVMLLNIKEGGNYGKHSDESKRIISASLIGSKRRLGKKHSEETKKKMSETKKTNLTEEKLQLLNESGRLGRIAQGKKEFRTIEEKKTYLKEWKEKNKERYEDRHKAGNKAYWLRRKNDPEYWEKKKIWDRKYREKKKLQTTTV